MPAKKEHYGREKYQHNCTFQQFISKRAYTRTTAAAKMKRLNPTDSTLITLKVPFPSEARLIFKINWEKSVTSVPTTSISWMMR